MSRKKLLTVQEKRYIAHLCKCFEEEGGDESFITKTVNATGASRRTIFRIRKELKEKGELKPQIRTKRGPYKKVDEDILRNKLQELLNSEKLLPPITKVHSVLRAEIGFPGSKELLRRLIHGLGYQWRKPIDNRKVFVEEPHILTQRMAFYDMKNEIEMKRLRLVFVDVSWIDTAYNVENCWQAQEKRSSPGLIVMNAGTRDGFISGAQLIYKAAVSSEDDQSPHDNWEMTGANFTTWLEEKLLPNLKESSAIVIDDASYHSMQYDKCPSQMTRKDDIKTWLREHRIQFNDDMTKSDLQQLVRHNKPALSYMIDEIIRLHGHEVLQLPPNHTQFNAMQHIWDQVKSVLNNKYSRLSLDKLKEVTEAALADIDSDCWRKAWDQVDKLVEDMKIQDNIKNIKVEKTDTDNLSNNPGSSVHPSSSQTETMDTDIAVKVEIFT